MSALFQRFTQRGLHLRNRLAVSPMCQYSSAGGMPGDWHLVHLGSRAVGGAAVVFTEALAVSPDGRISPQDAGLWNDAQAGAWGRIAGFIQAQGAIPAVQLAHAGRKASTHAPWRGRGAVAVADGGWQVMAPSAMAYDETYPQPSAMDAAAIAAMVADFADAARRALDADIGIVEIHAAHGYLLNQFLSPLSNRRDDGYGGGFAQRIRALCEVLEAVRAVWPERLPLWLRVSATDWAEGGWDVEQSIALARHVRGLGVDLVDVSSGGLVPWQQIPVAPEYQVPFAARIRREAGIATGAVGLVTGAVQAERIVADGDADVVMMARELLRDPYFPRRAAVELEVTPPTPDQYLRAW